MEEWYSCRFASSLHRKVIGYQRPCPSSYGFARISLHIDDVIGDISQQLNVGSFKAERNETHANALFIVSIGLHWKHQQILELWGHWIVDTPRHSNALTSAMQNGGLS